MKVDRYQERVRFQGEDGETLTVRYDNRGEPYREGLSLYLDGGERDQFAGVFLEEYEAKKLRDLLNTLYPPPCPNCKGRGRGGPNTTDGGENDDCRTCSASGQYQTPVK